jgi:hypothetical protein
MRVILPALIILTAVPVIASAQPGVAAVADRLPTQGERYYVTLFGGQGDLFRPRSAHTWATFVRTAVTPAGEWVVGEDTISWLPATLSVRPLALSSEPGVNLTLLQTFNFMGGDRRQRVAVWGPYEITAERYAQAIAQKALLESGAIRYHALGLLGRKADVMHCIDGVTRIDPVWEKKDNPSRWFGEAGTAQSVRSAVRSGFILHPTVTHDWIIAAINPTAYKLTPRSLNGRPLLGIVR